MSAADIDAANRLLSASALDALPIPIFVASPACVKLANPAARELLQAPGSGSPTGRPPDDLVTRSTWIRQGGPGLAELMDEAADHGRAHACWRMRSAAGYAQSWHVQVTALAGGPEDAPLSVITIEAQASDSQAAEALHQERKFFQQLFESAPVGIVVLDNQDRILDANPEFLGMFRYELDAIRGCTVNACIVPQGRKREGMRLTRRALGGDPVREETQRARSDGALVDVVVLGTPITIGENQIGVYAMYHDVSERKRAERELELAARALSTTAEGVMILDRRRRVVSVNEAFTKITGYGEQEIQGCQPTYLQAPGLDGDEYEAIWASLDKSGHWQGELWNRRKNGELYPELVSISAVENDHGEVTHYVVVFNDITTYKAYEDRLQFLADHDPLTQLPNRSLFHERLRSAIRRARRYERIFAVIFIDLDHFKPINDSMGHAIGDELLKFAARCLSGSIRKSDTAARLGGDEFAILAEDLASTEAASAIIGRVQMSLSEGLEIGGATLSVGSSAGIAYYPLDGADADRLLKNADAAMYEAKKQGRNTYHFFHSNDQAPP